MKTKISRNLTLGILLFVGLFITALSTKAATFTVNLASDAGDLTCDATCTLRDAVDDANNLAGDDTINFAAGLTTITLANEIVIANNGALTITGLGADVLTIDGGAGTNRIFYNNTGATITITDVTLTGGGGGGALNSGDGGAIYASGGTLSLTRVHITGNSATARGGGIFAPVGTRSITDSTISNNSVTAGMGGGMMIFSATTVNITNSTISGNTSTGNGGGILIDSTTTTTLRSATITNNAVTFAGSGGGIIKSGGGVLNIGNSIVAGNSATGGSPPEISNNATITSSGFNLVGDAAGDAANTGSPITYQITDILDTPPLLNALGNNGGTTPTHALQAFSPARDKGSSFGLTTDQRGLTRPIDFPTIPNAAGGDGADIGAFELQGPTAAMVSISGRVRAANGRGISKVFVSLTDVAGQTRTTYTSVFGYYKFDGADVGQTYVLSVASKRYQFAQPVKVIYLQDELSDEDFVALP